jgi:hypothetical protein
VRSYDILRIAQSVPESLKARPFELTRYLGHKAQLEEVMVETYIVYPSNKHNRPAAPDAIKLHSLDGLSAPIQIHNHRFFQSTERHISEIVEKLKSALAEALEFYPPVAGTVLINDNGDIYIDTHSENGSGTPLLVDIKDTPYTHDTEDLSPRTEVILPPGSSTFAAKITKVLWNVL